MLMRAIFLFGLFWEYVPFVEVYQPILLRSATKSCERNILLTSLVSLSNGTLQSKKQIKSEISHFEICSASKVWITDFKRFKMTRNIDIEIDKGVN